MKKNISYVIISILVSLILVNVCQADNVSFDNPIGYSSVSELLSAILNKLMGVVAIIAIIFIVLGGIFYMFAGADENMVKRAKACWTGAVIGMAIVLAAPTFLKEIKNILGGGPAQGGNADSWVSGALTIQQIALNVLNLLLSLVGIIAIISLVIGGGMYLTAYGDEDRIKKGKNIITYSIIGIVVSLASLVVVRQLASLISAN